MKLMKVDVPEWLVSSEQYEEFFRDEDYIILEEIFFRESNGEVGIFSDFINLYRTVGYWGAEIPESIYDYYVEDKDNVMKFLTKNSDDSLSKILIEYLTGLHFKSKSTTLLDSNTFKVSIEIILDTTYKNKIFIEFSSEFIKHKSNPNLSSTLITIEKNPETNKKKQKNTWVLLFPFERYYNYALDFIFYHNRLQNIIYSLKNNVDSLELPIWKDLWQDLLNNSEITRILQIKNSTFFCGEIRYEDELINNKKFTVIDEIFSIKFKNKDTLIKLFEQILNMYIKHYREVMDHTLKNLLTLPHKYHNFTLKGNKPEFLNSISNFSKELQDVNWNHNYYDFNNFINNLTDIYHKLIN